MNTPYEDLVKFFGVLMYRGEPEWVSPNRKIFEDDAVILRRFDEDRSGEPLLIVPPQAGHHSSIADYSPDHSLVKTCLANTSSPVFAIEWKSSTCKRQGEGIGDLVKQLMLCVKMAGPRVTLAGLCQGGWLSAIYTSLFPRDVKALILAASPIDFSAGGGKIQEIVNTIPFWYYRYMVSCGGGNMLGDYMLMGWKLMNSYDRFVGDYVNLWLNAGDRSYIERAKRFSRWYEYTQDISGRWYLEVVKDLFKENKLVKGELEVLGTRVDLKAITCPLALLAGERDDITLIPQVHNIADHASTPMAHIFKAIIPNAGHISVFMGKRALQHEWPDALRFLRELKDSKKEKRTSSDSPEMAASI